MDLLHEIAVRAKWDGTCTMEWPALRTVLSDGGGLDDFPGANGIQKLKAWAERQGLLMDLEVEFSGCTSQISTVTFSSNRQIHSHAYAGECGVAEDHNGSEVGELVARG